MFERRAMLTAFFFFLMKHHLLGRMTDDKLQLLRLGYLADIFFKMKKSEPITSRKTNGSIYCQNVEFSSKTQNFGTLISNIFH